MSCYYKLRSSGRAGRAGFFYHDTQSEKKSQLDFRLLYLIDIYEMIFGSDSSCSSSSSTNSSRNGSSSGRSII